MNVDLELSKFNKVNRGISEFVSTNSMVVVLFVIIIFGAIVSKGIFLKPTNLLAILFQTSIVGVIALGQMLVIISGGIDLSVASVAILVAIVMGGTSSIRQQALSFSGLLPFIGLIPAMLLGLASGAFMGLLNGLIITFLGETILKHFVFSCFVLMISFVA